MMQRRNKKFTTPEKLEEISRNLNRLRIKMGMIGGTIKVEPLNDNINGRPIEAEIRLEQWEAFVRLNIYWNPNRDIVIEYCSKKGIIDPVEQLCYTAGAHEISHWKVCPYSIEKHVDIQDDIADFLKYKRKKSKSLIHYLTNCFEDIVDNAYLRYNGDRSLSVFYSETGHFTKFFAAYMLVQLHVWGDADDRKLLQPNFSKLSDADLAEAKTTAENVLREWGVLNMSQEDIYKVLMNEKKWVSMARIFAKNTYHLVEMVKGNAKPKKCQQSDGEGRREEQEVEGSASGEKDNKKRPNGDIEDSGEEYDPRDIANGSDEDDKVTEKKSGPGSDTMDKELEKDDQKRKVMESRIKRKGSAAHIPHFMELSEAIEYYYYIIAPDIPIIAEEENSGMSFPVKRYGKDEFDPDIQKSEDIFGVMINDKGNITLGAHRFKYNMNFPFMKGIKRFPNVMWIVDTSGSMFEEESDNSFLPWSEKCSYHFALLGAFGTMKWLQRNDILPYIKLQMVTFSDKTIASGWRDFLQADAIRRAMFTYQSGGTELDPNVLCPELDNADPSLIILLSDSDIINWNSVKHKILASLERHQVVFIRLGSYGNRTASDFAAAGHPVIQVTKGEDMANLIIDVTKNTMNAVIEAERE